MAQPQERLYTVDAAGIRKRPLPLAILLLLRPKQWTKNLLVFAAILFTGGIAKNQLLTPVLITFLSLCFASSAIYALNDLLDVERDRAHPKKRNRPIASGSVPVPVATLLVPVLLVGALWLGFTVNISTAVVVGLYLALHSLYNLGMKHTAVADVFAISLGFVLRAVAGAAAISVGISGWLLFCTGALALMLGFGKRRQEYVIHGEERGKTRESLNQYSLSALDAMVMMSACAAALCYGIYAIESATGRQYPALVLTSAPVFYGICRYILVVFTQNEGGEPESLLFSDKHILLSVLAFVAMVMIAMTGVEVPFLESRR